MRWPPRINLPYRPCVGIMLINKDNKVFIARRIDTKGKSWQMPQGGIDRGETPEDAALRELKEEIGTNNATIIAKATREYTYDLPASLIGRLWNGRFKGQRQTWFLMRFVGEDDEINLLTHHPEFSVWKWAAISDLPAIVVPFKKDVYKSVVNEFKNFL